LEFLLTDIVVLTNDIEHSPSDVAVRAQSLCRRLEDQDPTSLPFDEHAYFLGELLLITGTANRLVARRTEARRWLQQSEEVFARTSAPASGLRRVSYQKLALLAEQREFDEVLESLPSLIASCEMLGMDEEALKCRFLEAIALMETERLDEAIDVFHDLARRARELQSQNLLATASYNLFQLFAMKGDMDRAIPQARDTIPLLRRLRNRVGLAKIRWGVGRLLQTKGNRVAAIDAYRAAQEEFREIGMRADIAALHLVIADILMDLNEDEKAVREILAALPVIEQEGMVPEGMAALALLQESVRQHRINRQALRDLHVYFAEVAE
jgi:tetratricopeptide (TPR) repeat protein